MRESEDVFFSKDWLLKFHRDAVPPRSSLQVEFAKRGSDWVSKTGVGLGQEFQNSNVALIIDGTMLSGMGAMENSQATLNVDDFRNNWMALFGLENAYFRQLGWNPARKACREMNIEYRIPEDEWKYVKDSFDHPFVQYFVIEYQSEYRIVGQEQVEGFPCTVLEYPGVDKIWIDVEHGHTIRKRLYYRTVDEKILHLGIVNSDLRQIGEGVWVPYRQFVDIYHNQYAKPELRNKIQASVEYVVDELTWGQALDPAMFERTRFVPAGSFVADSRNDSYVKYTTVDESSDPFEVPAKRLADKRRKERYQIAFRISFAVLVLVLGAGLFWKWRRGSSAAAIICMIVIAHSDSLYADEGSETVASLVDGMRKSEELFFSQNWFLKFHRNAVDPRSSLQVEFAKRGANWVSKTDVGLGQEFQNSDVALVVDGSILSGMGELDDLSPLLIVNDFRNNWMPLFDLENSYFRHLGWNPARKACQQMSIEYQIPEDKWKYVKDSFDHPFVQNFVIENQSEYRTVGQDQVEGFPCTVMEYPGVDKIWIDVQHGHAIRKRLYYRTVDEKTLHLGVVNSDLRQIGEGLWMPFRQFVDIYHNQYAKPELKNMIEASVEYVVDELTWGQELDPAMFARSRFVPTGSKVFDRRGKSTIEYTTVDESSDPFEMPAKKLADKRSKERFKIAFRISFAVLVLVLGAGLFWKWRRGSNAAAIICLVAITNTGSLHADARQAVVADVSSSPSNAGFQFMPSWRDEGDCGPLSLYFLMNAMGWETTIDAVKREVNFTADEGCSLRELSRAGSALGFENRLVFINRKQFWNLKPPFVIHTHNPAATQSGHFVAVAELNPNDRTISMIRTDNGDVVSRAADPALIDFTGYVMVPDDGLTGVADKTASGILVCSGVVIAIAAMVGVFRSRSQVRKVDSR